MCTGYTFNPLGTNEFFLVWYNKPEMVHCIYPGVTGYNFLVKIVFLSLKIVFALANSVDSDEMPHYVAFIVC